MRKEKGERLNTKAVFCQLCEKDVNYSQNTTNLRQHLESHHPEVLASSSKAHGVETRSVSSSTKKLPTGCPRSTEITQAIAGFVAKDMRPAAVVDLLPISLLLPRVQLVPPFSSTLSLFPLPELNHSSCPFLFLCVICGIIFLYLLLCCPVLVCSNYLFYVCITDCLNLLRFITVIYFCPLYHLLLYSVFLTHSPYILFFSPVLYLLVGHLVFSIWLLF